MPANQNYVLTNTTDNIGGDATDNVISGDSSTFSSADIIDGGAGNDTLNLSATGPATFQSTQVSNVETANVTGYNTVTVDARTWAGLTALNVSAIGGDTIKAPSGAAVTDHVQYLGAGSIAIDGGSAVTVDATNATTGTITIGATTAPTGVVTVNRTTTGSVYAGDIVVTGGSTVNVNQNVANTANGNASNGFVTVNGSAATTAVNVTAASAPGTSYNYVMINDANAGSATAGGTITSVSADGYTAIGIADTALTNLTLTRGSGNIIVDNSGLTTPTNTTLNVTLNGITGGTLDDADIYRTINITTTGVKSRLANITTGALTDLNIGGSTGLTLTSTAGLSALAHVTVAGAAGVTADFSAATVTSLDTSASTGTSTVSIDGSRATYTGGAGVDNVTLSRSTVSKAIALGGGDDTLTLASGTTLPTSTVDGGSGNDTLGMRAADAVTASASNAFAAKVTGFETLAVTGGTGAQTIDLAALGNYTAVTTGGEAASGTLTLQNLASGGTLALTSNAGSGSAYVVANTAFSAGASDTLNLKLAKAGLLAAGTVNAADVENFNISTSDTQATPTNPLDTLTLAASSAKSITVSGNAGLNLTAASTNLTSVDASGITAGDFTWNSGALTSAATIKGSATGTNTVNLAQAAAPVTYVGGSGIDTLVVGAGNDMITTGAGADAVTIAASSSLNSFSTITDAHDGESIGFASRGTEVFASNKLTLGAGASLTDYANAVITGAGDASTNGHLGWFQFGGDTYLVESRSAAHTSFTDGSDAIVKLQGLFDLSTATLSSHALLLSDTTPPAQPATPTLTDASDSGTLGDGLTTVTTPTVTGTAEGGSRVTLFDTNGSTVLGTGLADRATGAYSITSTTLGLGTHGLTVKATDASGNISAASSALALTIQDGAPPVPTGGGGSGGGTPAVTIPVIVTTLPDAPVVAVPTAPVVTSPPSTLPGPAVDTPAPSSPAVTEDFTSDIAGEPYTAYHTRYDAAGDVAVRTYFGPRGGLFKQESTERAADGSKTVMTSKGSDLAQQPFFAYVDHYSADGTQTEQDVFYRDGHQSVEGLVAGVTLNAIANDTFFTTGGSNTFAFASGFGHDTITSFVLGGDDHDTIDLPAASQGRLRSILGHATTDGNGDAVLHLGHGDAITVQGVTVADLKQHRGDFTFNG